MNVSIIGVKGYPIVYGGYETLVHSLVEKWRRYDIKIAVYCHSSMFNQQPTIINGVKLIYLPAIEKKSLSQLTHSFISTIHACFSRADIIFYVNVANAPFGFIPRLFGKKTVINVDGLEWLRPKWKGLGSFYFKICARLVKFSFHGVITDASEMQRLYKEKFNTSSTVLTYGAKHPTRYFPELLNQFNLVANDYYLVVGRMIPDNNLDLIVDAYLQSNSSKKLVIIGDDIFKDQFALTIQQKIQGNQSIVLTGYINNHDHLCTFYHNCFAYIHGHEFGGTNPTMVNALNENCFILALHTPFTQEMLDDGRNGLFFQKNSIELALLIEAVEKEDYYEELKNFRQKGRTRVDAHYQWDRIADGYYQLFKYVLNKVQP
jgi:glycosyltransferase involved in cell wall biosynthesis